MEHMPTNLRAVKDRIIQFPRKYRIKEALAALLLASPLLVIFFDNSVPPSSSLSPPILGTFLILGTIPVKLRRFHRLEFAMPLFFPAIVTAMLSAFIYFLQSWKETKLARHQTDETRSALVSSLGLQPAGDRIVTLSPWWGVGAAALYWGVELLAHLHPIPTQAVVWLPFLLFAAGLVTMLTSPHGMVKPKRELPLSHSLHPVRVDIARNGIRHETF